MDNLPFVYDPTNTGYQNANVWRLRGGFCVGLDGKVDATVVGSLDGQVAYGLTEEVGLLIWMGDTNYSRGTAMSGNSWENVFSGCMCVGNYVLDAGTVCSRKTGNFKKKFLCAIQCTENQYREYQNEAL